MKTRLLFALALGASCHSAEELSAQLRSSPETHQAAEEIEASVLELGVEHVLGAPVEPIGSGSKDGWTTFDDALRERTIFVSSSSGNDSWTGTSILRPKRSLAAAKEELRSGHADRLLLKRGDRFAEGLGQWKKSGRNRMYPMLVSSYGDSAERPVLVVKEGAGLVTHGGGGSPPRVDHIAIVGLHFLAERPRGRSDAAGVSWHQPSRDLLIEDCVFERFSTGLVVQGIGGRHENFVLRRSVIVDSFNTVGGNPQGIYMVHVDGALIEECVFDQNGWMPGVEGAGADIFSHNLYLDTNNSGVVVRDNIIANGASHGIQMRSGGLCEGNLLVRNSIALMMAGRAGPRAESALARNNVILDGKNIDEANPRGWGIDFNDIVSGEITGNVIAHNGPVGFPLPLLLNGDGHGKHVKNVEVARNVIFGWGGPVQFLGNAESLSNILVQHNVLQDERGAEPMIEMSRNAALKAIRSCGNRYRHGTGSWLRVGGNRQTLDWWLSEVNDLGSANRVVSFTDSERSVESWNALHGGSAELGAFLREARKQSRSSWRKEFTARAVVRYVRTGFDLN